ncbi:hypothetical protein [Aquimarina sp. RZ0]|uniref:hypothetical protein n=1 Tax=Aquimarina sp. RZ0 TaxID=2607730 RepID=UPI0011F1568E|nr:hypothetical protein [Aquimarina sp. RZ0]KAA1244057.1 hypothetical protein F0000_18205 [Aquimarina sp. RZ0]
MNTRIWLIYIGIFTLYSCDTIIVKKESREAILKEKWKEIDKNEVGEPPLFTSCENMSQEKLQECFNSIIIDHIGSFITEKTILVKENISDTIWLSLLIDKKGDIILEDFQIPEYLKKQVPDFKDLIDKGINTLPALKPAHKRGYPTNAKYRLPIILRSN